MKLQPAEIRGLWEESIARSPQRLTGDIAQALGISEAELIASRIGLGAIRLAPRWHDLLASLGTLGPVRAVTRNAHAVMERDGVYPEYRSSYASSMFVSDDIDLRITPSRWAFAFALETTGPREGGVRRSVQFYSEDGIAIHKLFLTDASNAEQFYALVAHFQDPDQSEGQCLRPIAMRYRSPREVDVKAFLREWGELKHPHHFFGLLERHKLSRLHAIQFAEGLYTRRVANSSPRRLLMDVAKDAIPVSVQLANPGCLQIHKGLLQNVNVSSGWLNVVDPGAEIHIREASVDHTWVVEKPSPHGYVYSLELFDGYGGDIVSILGARKDGTSQDVAWQGVLSALPDAA
ncbi:MAG: ChuX/HutX family heme-like substrate-binding protein [Acidobacteriota bacterium]